MEIVYFNFFLFPFLSLSLLRLFLCLFLFYHCPFKVLENFDFFKDPSVLVVPRNFTKMSSAEKTAILKKDFKSVSSLFKENKGVPINIELCSGHGQWTIEMAKKYKNENWYLLIYLHFKYHADFCVIFLFPVSYLCR